jgi:ubiquinone/menaquinone biosynthesis C-methylase UbiE
MIKLIPPHVRFLAIYICRSVLQNRFNSEKRNIRENLKIHDRGKVLDFGCGAGHLSELFKPNRYIGIDPDKTCINFAKKRYKGIFLCMNGKILKFKNSYFDSAIACEVFHHIPDLDLEGVLKEIKRVLKEFGKFIIIDPVPCSYQASVFGKILFKFDRGKYPKEPKKLKDILSKHFKIDKHHLLNSGLYTLQVFVVTNQ